MDRSPSRVTPDFKGQLCGQGVCNGAAVGNLQRDGSAGDGAGGG